MMLRVFDFRAVASTRQTYVVVLVPGSKKRSKKRVGVKRGLVEKKERSPFLSPIHASSSLIPLIARPLFRSSPLTGSLEQARQGEALGLVRSLSAYHFDDIFGVQGRI